MKNSAIFYSLLRIFKTGLWHWMWTHVWNHTRNLMQHTQSQWGSSIFEGITGLKRLQIINKIRNRTHSVALTSLKCCVVMMMLRVPTPRLQEPTMIAHIESIHWQTILHENHLLRVRKIILKTIHANPHASCGRLPSRVQAIVSLSTCKWIQKCSS